MKLEQYAVVRVRQLLREPAKYYGWHLNQRQPQIGDVGAVVEILNADSSPECYVVESVGEDGQTIWLADFVGDELELCVLPTSQAPE